METADSPRAPSPLLKSDKCTITFEPDKEGRVRMTYLGWEEPRVLLVGEGLLIRWGGGQVQAYRVRGGEISQPMGQVDELEVRRALKGTYVEAGKFDDLVTLDGAAAILDALGQAGFKVVKA